MRKILASPSSQFLSRSVLALLLGSLVAFACSSDPEIDQDSDGGSDSDGGNDSGSGGRNGVDSGSDSGLDGGIDGSLGGRGPGGGDGTPEVCDGIDNDGDGLIDNVDAGGDGICDCLKIATLGRKGPWGEGDVFANWLDGKSTAGVVDLAYEELTLAKLEEFDVIVAQDMGQRNGSYTDDVEYTEDEVEALNDWISQGGGLMTMIGYEGPRERNNINALLAPTGLRYGSEQILSKSGGYTRPVNDSWHATHPIANGITAIGVDNGYPVNASGSGSVVVAEEGGHVVARAKQVDDGRVFVWGDEWISYNSEWEQDEDAPVKYEIERFWLNIIQWLGPQDACQVPIPPGIR